MDNAEDNREEFVRISGTQDCQHPNLSYVGGDKGGNEYFRCGDCGGVIIREGSVSHHELKDRIEAEKQEEGPKSFSDLLKPRDKHPSPSVSSKPNNSRSSLSDTLREKIAEYLPFYDAEERKS